jgi:NAD(P)H-hydrate epimerase
MKIVTAAEMREIDRLTTEKYGIPSLTLMENAGSAVAEFVLLDSGTDHPIGVLCGRGNNGGDGLVAARKLHEAGKSVKVLLLADPSDLKGDAAEMLKKLPVSPVVVRNEEDLRGPAAKEVLQTPILVDAILGTGFRPPVTGLNASAIRLLNAQLGRVVIAVDLPSGACADEPFEPSPELVVMCGSIVTFTAPKPVHVLPWFSFVETVVAQIGTPPEALISSLNLEVITAEDISTAFKRRRPDAHKGDFGHVLVIGGSLGKAGAAAMAGMAALRAGAGLVTVAVPRSVLPTVAGYAPELMTEPLEEDGGVVSLRALEYERLEKLSEGKSVIALGPGISRHPEAAEFVRAVVAKSKLPVVLDADGLNAFQGCADQLDGSQRPLVLTPHPGEMARLVGLSTEAVQQDRVGVARKFAADHHCVVVLKGWRTLIAQPDGSVWLNTTGNPGMATGGTGDVLTGMIASLLAQYSAERYGVHRVLAAVHLHGLAGDLARDELGEHSLIATDLLRFLPHAFRVAGERAGDRFVRIS